MKKSLPAFRFITALNTIFPSGSPIKLFLFFLITVLLAASANAQDAPNSVGLVPISDMKISTQEPVPFAVGTRAFLQLSISPNVQFAKSFMENCTYTTIGPPFAAPFPRGLVYRNGLVYTWNQSSPYQLWQVDTVTGIYTLVYNITGVPQPNFTGMCWDGTTLYGVSTNLSSSQIFIITAGGCIPIGTPTSVCAGAIILFGRQYAGSSLFSVDMVFDNFYRWNKNTGIATLIGPVGFNSDIRQAASFDGNTCYWVANSQLRRWDTTGNSVVLCSYPPDLVIGIACVPNTPFFPGQLLSICRNGINVAVPDNSIIGARDTITSNLCSWGTVFDINIVIDTFLHTWDGDMAFTLTHNSTTVQLITNRGGNGDNFIGTILNDSAANPISSGTAPFTGSYRPEQPLTVFNSQTPNGNWILFMVDNAAGDLGFLRAWCLKIVYSCADGIINTSEIPFTYKLSQNYPNPFNPVTTIKYGLPKFGKTSLIVYDILGRVVTKLVDNEFKDAGTYEIQWDASNYSSGIYFYTMESGSYKETKKMVLIK